MSLFLPDIPIGRVRARAIQRNSNSDKFNQLYNIMAASEDTQNDGLPSRCLDFSWLA